MPTRQRPPGRIAGVFRRNRAGFGFITCDPADWHEDFFVAPRHTLDAISGDRVSARVVCQGKRAGRMSYEARITQVLDRGRTTFVGVLARRGGRDLVEPDGDLLQVPIFVADAKAKRAKPGDHVVVEIVEYPAPGREARGVITRLLGPAGDPGVDVLGIIHQHDLPQEFPNDALAEARRAVADYDADRAAVGREDLRKLTVITIDPADARDFDDAISLTSNDDGTVELGVHIADVGAFVPPGGALDAEARRRSNSVYLPEHVIPMLPEVLSNGLCSLQEREPRLTKSVFITYDRAGKVRKTRFANTVIRSTKRLVYEKATEILDGKVGRYSRKVVELLRRMEALARRIQRRRQRQGMLVLDLPEIELVFDDQHRVVDAVPADDSFSHTIIEMFMVEANEAVARLLDERGVPCLHRIHPEPDERRIRSLARLLGAVHLPAPKSVDRHVLQRLLATVKGRPESFVVNLAVLRSMQPAEYSPGTIGHFALASKHYLHFTSPIRRYPDLTAHRLLDEYLAGTFDDAGGHAVVPDTDELTELGGRCSANEERAEQAERELKLVKVLRLLEGKLGDAFEGVVTGVTSFGIFVQLRRYLIDGLVRFSDLPDDWWSADADRTSVTGERSGVRITIGDLLEVGILRVDVPSRQLDLWITRLPQHRSSRQARPSSRPARRKKRAATTRGAPRAGRTTRPRPAPRRKGSR